MAIYVLPNNTIVDTSQISKEELDLTLYRQGRKSLYDLAIKDKKEMERISGKVPKGLRELEDKGC